MPKNPDKLTRFWQELKRRKVFGVVTTYAATAYLIIEVTNNLVGPLNLPVWIAKLVIILLGAGLPIAVILSWIFDFTPQGIKKTESAEESKSKESAIKPVKRKLRPSYVLNAILIIAVIVLAYPKIFQRDSLRKLQASDVRIPLAIMPFQNMSNDSTLNYLEEWIPESVTSYLSNYSEDLEVRQTESIYSLIKSQGLKSNASVTPSVASLISQKLDANIIISGSLIKAGIGIIVNANLINSKTEEVLKSFQEEGNPDEIIKKIDTLSQKIKNYLVISKLKKGLSPDIQLYVGTSSPEALRHYVLGGDAVRNEDYRKAVEEYLEAIRIDPNFTYAILNLIDTYENDVGLYDSAKILSKRLYDIKDKMTPQSKLRTEYAYSTLYKMPYDCIKYLKQLLELDDQQPEMHFNLGKKYNEVKQQNKAIAEVEKSLEIYKKWSIKPPTADNYTFLLDAYRDTKQNKKEERLIKKAGQDFPDNVGINWCEFRHSLDIKDTIMANDHREKVINLSRENFVSEFNIALYLAYMYGNENYPKKSEEYIQKAFKLVDNDPIQINNLAWFLIVENVNINEGLELVDKALELSPNNYAFLDTKGWGLYKQGKYKEALDCVQKADSLKPTSYEPTIFLHIQELKMAIASQKNN